MVEVVLQRVGVGSRPPYRLIDTRTQSFGVRANINQNSFNIIQNPLLSSVY